MTVADRVRRRRMEAATRELTAGESLTESPSSTLAVRRSPVVLRLQAVMGSLNSFVIENGEPGLAKLSFLMSSLTDEVIEELTERDEETIGLFMSHMGEVIAWIGHGDDTRLPEPLRAFTEGLQRPIAEVS